MKSDLKERFMLLVDKNEKLLCRYPVFISNAGAAFAHFIIPASHLRFPIDFGNSAEETLHRLIDNGFSEEEICEITGMERHDDDAEYEDEKWVYVDLDYYIPIGSVMIEQVSIVKSVYEDTEYE